MEDELFQSRQITRIQAVLLSQNIMKTAAWNHGTNITLDTLTISMLLKLMALETLAWKIFHLVKIMARNRKRWFRNEMKPS
jgi:hypothetical protein